MHRAAHLSRVLDRIDPQRLRRALASIDPAAWSLPSQYAATRVHHGYRKIPLVTSGFWHAEADGFRFALDVLAPAREAWLSQLDPGGFIVPHCDAGPWFERWHVPIQPAGEFRTVDPPEPSAGVPFRVEHWSPHAVVNDTDRPRVHLVVDRNVKVDRPTAPLVVHPIPEDMAGLVQRSLLAQNP